MPSLNTSSTNSQIENISTDYATAALSIYSGTPPANANTALSSNTELVQHTVAGFGSASLGVIVADAIATEEILATGTASFARLVQGGNTMQVTVGTGAQELVVSSVSYVDGEDSTINSLQITQPAT